MKIKAFRNLNMLADAKRTYKFMVKGDVTRKYEFRVVHCFTHYADRGLIQTILVKNEETE